MQVQTCISSSGWSSSLWVNTVTDAKGNIINMAPWSKTLHAKPDPAKFARSMRFSILAAFRRAFFCWSGVSCPKFDTATTSLLTKTQRCTSCSTSHDVSASVLSPVSHLSLRANVCSCLILQLRPRRHACNSTLSWNENMAVYVLLVKTWCFYLFLHMTSPCFSNNEIHWLIWFI